MYLGIKIPTIHMLRWTIYDRIVYMKAEKGHTFQRYVCIHLYIESGLPSPSSCFNLSSTYYNK